MAAAGVECVADVTGEAPVGFVEVIGHLGSLRRAFRRLRSVIARPSPPRAVVLIDFPEFNLRLARVARRAGVPVIYFIPPQIWAWRPGRVRTIRRLVALVLAVFPFERALYQRAGVPVEFVGHPVRDRLVAAPSRAAARGALGLGAEDEVIGLLPGSRSGGDRCRAHRHARRRRPDRPGPAGGALRAGPGSDGGRARGQVGARTGLGDPDRRRTDVCRHARGRSPPGGLGDRDARGGAARHADGRVLSARGAERADRPRPAAGPVDEPAQPGRRAGRGARTVPTGHDTSRAWPGPPSGSWQTARGWPRSARPSRSWPTSWDRAASPLARRPWCWRWRRARGEGGPGSRRRRAPAGRMPRAGLGANPAARRRGHRRAGSPLARRGAHSSTPSGTGASS